MPVRWVLPVAYRRQAADPTHSLMWHYLAALREWPT